MAPTRDDSEPGYETTVSLVSRGLALSVALTSLPVLLIVAVFTVLENDPVWVVALAGVLLFAPIVLLTRLRFVVELTDGQLRYRLRPWHRRLRVVPVESISRVERLGRRPTPEPRLRRVTLGRGWVDWDDDEVRYVLGDDGIRITRDEGRTLELWFSGMDELVRELADARDDTRAGSQYS